ncbi:MAG: cytochrome B [Rhodospirillaceae bacterium]|nr:cytochrome B [Rhodospirillaceae bacterium]
MNIYFINLARIALALAFLVVTIGAWVRLTDAGLGCPDWPGCYGQLTVPNDDIEFSEALSNFPERPLEAGKAWREMVHRYLASVLGFLCVLLAGLAWLNRRDPKQETNLPYILVAVVIFQGILGMWTVTLLLKPVVVMAHLLGGLTTLGILFWLGQWRLSVQKSRFSLRPLRVFALSAMLILVLQISLGGWTSSNYAALACPDFPTCQTKWWPPVTDFHEGFVLWRGIGIDYEGGVLDNPARVAIHFTHRLGAIVTTIFLSLLGWLMIRRKELRPDGFALFIMLFIQLALGVSIVVYSAPLSVAVAHNGVGALLLLTVLNANQRIRNS